MLPLVSSSGITVRDIEGLDPVAATLSSTSMAQLDGAQPQHSRRDTRNIVMKLGLEPDWASQSVGMLRAQLYDYLMTKANVNLGFYIDSNLFATSAGQVESFDSPLFSQDPEADISIVCADPDFYGFPVEIDGATRTDQVPTTIDYPGTSDAGVIFSILLSGMYMDEISIYNTTPSNAVQKMTVEGTFVPGDNLIINTIPGQRGVTLVRGGFPISMLTGLTSSQWLTLQRGINFFRAIGAAKTSGNPIPYIMTYTPKYGGL